MNNITLHDLLDKLKEYNLEEVEIVNKETLIKQHRKASNSNTKNL